MRLALAILTLALTGCNSTPEATHPTRDYTVGTAQCSKFKFGTSEMAQCLDRAAESQAATVAGGSGTNG
ncbi:hypothetical protein [Bosea sp. TAF32]|uniref:hypothetical protein n=1 Tax=Bosea sp. TAF32 TaxID=3237482 RepID=UPI003F9397FB